MNLTDTCPLLNTISIHDLKFEEQNEIYKLTLDGKENCKINE